MIIQRNQACLEILSKEDAFLFNRPCNRLLDDIDLRSQGSRDFTEVIYEGLDYKYSV